MKPISALTLLHYMDNPVNDIIVLCYNPQRVAEEVRLFIVEKNWVLLKFSSSNEQACIEGLNKIWFLNRETADETLRGVRARTLLLEGTEESYDEEFLNQVVAPMHAVMRCAPEVDYIMSLIKGDWDFDMPQPVIAFSNEEDDRGKGGLL